MLRFARMGVAATVGLLLLAGCVSLAQLEREQLTKQLGRDPVAILRAIVAVDDDQHASLSANDPGRAAASKSANKRVSQVLEELANKAGMLRLRLVRFGLGSDDEQVVFGAALLMDDQLPVPSE